MRAVLDPNVLVSALLSRRGVPAVLLGRWLEGLFELVVSDALLDELARALAYPRVAAHVDPSEAQRFVALLRRQALCLADPPERQARSSDPDDDYLPALAEAARAVLVSGDRHLLALAPAIPVLTPRAFFERLEAA